ncbi:MAG: RhuM family protein, partial [Candidatus Caldatribacteriota bacterium]|nr:RhuM family protein [Candidatus Caldatribacteriota bacterium]
MSEKNEIIIYTTQDGKETFEVNLKKDTVWLSQKQMAELFEKDVRTVNEHIGNIYKEKELNKVSTIRKFRIVQKEGNRQVERIRNCYNLDVIISVGYRVNSQRGTQFRIWATNILKQHLITGYTINEKRI